MSISKATTTLLTAALLLGATPILGTAPALAYDDDVDFVCDTYDGEDFCVSVEDLKIECPIVDPDNELELCQGLNESRVSPSIQGFRTSPSKRILPLRAAVEAKNLKKVEGRAARHFRLMNQSSGNNDDTSSSGGATNQGGSSNNGKSQGVNSSGKSQGLN